MVMFLVEIGADIHKINKYGVTALYGAAENGYVDIVRLLVEAGANICVEEVKVEEEEEEEEGENCYYYSTPLYRAAVRGHVDIVRLLVEAGADFHEQSEYIYLYMLLFRLRPYYIIN